MNLFLVLYRLFKTGLPMIMEYVNSSTQKKTQINVRGIHWWIVFCFIIIATVVIYLSEQADKGLRRAEPMARQYNELVMQKSDLAKQLEQIKLQLSECEEKLNAGAGQCNPEETPAEGIEGSAGGTPTYVYDPGTRTMVLANAN